MLYLPPHHAHDGTAGGFGENAFRLRKQADARGAYGQALAQMDVGAPQRRLVELKLTEVGGSPARTEGSTP